MFAIDVAPSFIAVMIFSLSHPYLLYKLMKLNIGEDFCKAVYNHFLSQDV